MIIQKTKFKDLKLIISNIHRDHRGSLREIYKKKLFSKNLIFDYYSTSKKNVIRGFHFQIKKPQAKLISVLKGRILDICIDLRKNSKTYGKTFKVVLSERNKKSLFIPEGFAHAFCAIDKHNMVLYKNSNYRNKHLERGILWNDSDLNIKWPTKKPVVSIKDKKNMTFSIFLKKYKTL